MDPVVEPANPVEAQWVASQRKWTHWWRRLLIPTVFLVYLFYVAHAGTRNRTEAVRTAEEQGWL